MLKLRRALNAMVDWLCRWIEYLFEAFIEMMLLMVSAICSGIVWICSKIYRSFLMEYEDVIDRWYDNMKSENKRIRDEKERIRHEKEERRNRRRQKTPQHTHIRYPPLGPFR